MKKQVLFWFLMGVIVVFFFLLFANLAGFYPAIVRPTGLRVWLPKVGSQRARAVFKPQAITPPAKTRVEEKKLYTLRLNVVEWSPAFEGVPFSRNIGPTIRKGMAEGKILNTSKTIVFEVEWWNAKGLSKQIITAQNGQAIIQVSPDAIGPDTWVAVQSVTRFYAPPDSLPLTTHPGELHNQIKNGVETTYLHFILPPH